MDPFVLLALGIMNIMGKIHNYGIDVEKHPHLKDIRVRRQIDSELYAFEDKEHESLRIITEETPEEPSTLLSKLKRDRNVREKRQKSTTDIKFAYPTTRYTMNGYNVGNNGYNYNYATSTPYVNTAHNNDVYHSKPYNIENLDNDKIGQHKYHNIARSAHNNVAHNNAYNSGTTNNRPRSVIVDAPVRSIEDGEYPYLHRKKRSYEDDVYKQVQQQKAAASAQITSASKQYLYNPNIQYSNGKTASSESIRYSTNYIEYAGNNNKYNSNNNGYNGIKGGYNDKVNNYISYGANGSSNGYYVNNNGYYANNNTYYANNNPYYAKNNTYYDNNNGYNNNWNNNYNTTNNGNSYTYYPFKNDNSLNNTLNRYQYNGYNVTSTVINGIDTKKNVTNNTVTSTTPRILSGMVIAGNFGCPKFMKNISIMGRKICMSQNEETDEDW